MMNSFLSFSLSLCACVTCFAPAFAVQVEATGRAPADAPEARAQALTDALREAVRSGAGVDLVSESQMTNFEMDFDRTFSQARGYVRTYKVLSNKVSDDGFYTVTISADVGEGSPEMNDTLTLKMMAREKGSPRVDIRITETIDGVKDSGLAADWLRQTATECGMRVVDAARSQGDGGAAAKRAALLGRQQEASMREQGVVSACDYIIEGSVIGRYAGEQSFYGSKPAKRYSLGLNLKVVDAATGVVLVTENPSSRDIIIRSVASDDAAAREAVRQLMDGDPRQKAKTDAGWRLVRRIFSHWAAEMDLGSTFKLEFTGLDLTQAQALCKALTGNPSIGAVNIRSIDAVGVSVIDCESRLGAVELASLIQQSAPAFKLDRSENRYLSFRPASGSASASGGEADDSDSSQDGSMAVLVSSMAAVLILIGGVIVLILRKKKTA